MTTITLEVPDELAVRLNPLREHLPMLLEWTLNSVLREKDKSNGQREPSSMLSPIYTEVLDFLASGPTLKQIAEFRVSQRLQTRVEELLDKNREEGLTEQEQAEMDTYLLVNHILMLLKARAWQNLSNSPH